MGGVVVQADDGRSLGDDKTFAGREKKPRSDVSLGDERSVGGMGLA